MTIEYWDYDGYGNSVYQKTETYQREVNVYVNPPSTCESFRESNPFNLMISTEGDPSNPLDGEFLISSGGSFSSPQLFEGCVLLQYWTFTVDGDSIRGTLMDTHDAEGMVLNSLWAWQEISPGFGTAWPYTMETGSTLEGTIDESEARLLIQGNSKCRTRPFTAEVLAIRVK